MSLHIKRLRNLFRECGVPDALIEITARLLRSVSAGHWDLRRFYVLSQPLAKLTSPRRARRASVTVRRVVAGDPLVQGLPRPAVEIADRFRAGAECFVAEQAGSPQAFVWVTRHEHLEAEVSLAFKPTPRDRAVWDFDLYVDPAARHSVALSRLWDAVAEQLINAGYAWTVSVIMAENSSSLRAHRRSGAHVVAAGIRLRLGSRTYTYVDTASHFSSARRGNPRSVVQVAADVDRSASYRRFSPVR